MTLWLMCEWWIPGRHSFPCLGPLCTGGATADKAGHCMVAAQTSMKFSILRLSAWDPSFFLWSYRGLCIVSFHAFSRMKILTSCESVIGKHLTYHRIVFSHTLCSWSLSFPRVLVSLFLSKWGIQDLSQCSRSRLVTSGFAWCLVLMQLKMPFTCPCFSID